MDELHEILAAAAEAAARQKHEGQLWEAKAEKMAEELQCQSELTAHFQSEFLTQHSEIYDELTKMRQHYPGKNIRTEIDGKKIYPQKPDRKIMQYAAVLSSQPIDNVGSIVVATHDGDFTVVARAFEERFGFGIAKNSRTLKQWLRES